jgi:hypothetical protein
MDLDAPSNERNPHPLVYFGLRS